MDKEDIMKEELIKHNLITAKTYAGNELLFITNSPNEAIKAILEEYEFISEISIHQKEVVIL